MAKEKGIEIEVTAVELDPELARMYQDRFPNDIVIIADAHQYLLDHYKEFDFIWSSPPCPTHSKARFWGSKGGKCNVVYPEMSLYQEIILLQNYYLGMYCIENVSGYYDPLIKSKKRGRHLYWCNFNLPPILSNRDDVAIKRGKSEMNNLIKFHEYDFLQYKGKQSKTKIARNLVDFDAGKTILQIALNIQKESNLKQQTLNF